ncbi:glycoside hydrolase family 3 N-terminal domain-containing protein [Treponema pedis]|uniref:beta-N-acetylhexosaminidase n=1 Tax=Treponema pedis str. T A4 TaxID=1291379 RepID=S5ZW71_9SPIR|nr:glycoside hydrolase family 3 N-terminal domain-containing protein [Treponema pedis]AGT44575.1 glycosyl hydrolase [Treponema pedis str. T A4]
MKLKCFLFFIFCINLYSENDKIYEFIAEMNAEEKAAQVLMLSIDGNKEFTKGMYKYFGNTVPGAFILFKFNLADTSEKTSLYIKSVKDSFKKIAKDKNYIQPIFAIDCEGGGVYRIKHFASHLPSAKEMAEKYSLSEAKELYKFTGEQIKLLGLHINLAPVVEVKNPENINFFGNRLYSDDKAVVHNYSSVCIEGMKEAGVISAVKHFPGNAETDPHKERSVIKADKQTFYDKYIEPFKTVLEKNKCAVLISHVTVPAVEDVPFCFSEKGIQNILREELNFKGLIITDDLAMAALKGGNKSSEANAISALQAGCDMIMCSENKLNELISVISDKIKTDKVFAQKIDKAVFNILTAKIEAGILDKNCKVIEEYLFDLKKFNTAKKEAEKILKK